ncbi:hypothetical protein FRB95_001824 [Tulasnella sp. JGI-2019a]|nr:hypothetical protein FRB93_013633 [Tulasnella sp. JGI-2019a]KAG9021633.1 hypothetical protein FRB95_001824 [Tulasnella sp. JGI-2019a]
MPPKPTVSPKTNTWRKYYVCKRHLEQRKQKTENHVRTYGTCPCFVSCPGTVHADDWNICVDKHGHGRCDHEQCNHFYLGGRCGFIDELDGKCYWVDDLEPVITAEGGHLNLGGPALTEDMSDWKPGSMRSRSMTEGEGSVA